MQDKASIVNLLYFGISRWYIDKGGNVSVLGLLDRVVPCGAHSAKAITKCLNLF